MYAAIVDTTSSFASSAVFARILLETEGSAIEGRFDASGSLPSPVKSFQTLFDVRYPGTLEFTNASNDRCNTIVVHIHVCVTLT